MKRIVFLAALAVCAIGLFSGSALAGGGHHHGHHHHGFSFGHGHHGFHVGHYGHFGHSGHSRLHLSFGLGHHRHFGYSSYRYTHPSYTYSYPRYGYSLSRYSYPTYRAYNYPSCISYRVIQPRPAPVAPAEPAEPQQRPNIDPPPEPLPEVPVRQADAPASDIVKFAVLRNTTERQYIGQVRSVARAGPSAGSAAASWNAQLGPQLSPPKSRGLVADEEIPWVVE